MNEPSATRPWRPSASSPASCRRRSCASCRRCTARRGRRDDGRRRQRRAGATRRRRRRRDGPARHRRRARGRGDRPARRPLLVAGRGRPRGRRIFANLRKAMGYLFAVHVPIVGLSLLPLLGGPVLLLPIHVVLLELIIDPACSLVFEAEPARSDLMSVPPRSPATRLFDVAAVVRALLVGGAALVAVVLAQVARACRVLLRRRRCGWSAWPLSSSAISPSCTGFAVPHAALQSKTSPSTRSLLAVCVLVRTGAPDRAAAHDVRPAA